MSWIFLFFMTLSFAATELAPIEVEASKDVEQFTFSTSTTITPVDLEKAPLMLISPELEKVPGLIANQNGGPGGRVSFFLRGTESRHLSFTLDGLKINDTSNTDRQFDGAFLTSPFLRKITVHKGPQAVLYGSDALGGLVEMTTRKGEDAPEAKFSLMAGSFGTVGSSLSKDWQTKESSGTLTASKLHSDGISRLNKKRYNADEKDAADITQLTSSSKHQWKDRFQTDLLASFLRGKAEQDGFGLDRAEDFSRNDQYILQQKTSYEIDSRNAVSLRNGFNRHQRLNNNLAGEQFFNGNLFQHELIHLFEEDNFALLSGISSEHEGAGSIRLDRSFQTHSAFLQSSFKLSEVKVHTGGRVDKHSRYGTFYTGSAGAAWRDFSAQYSQGYKAPSLYQLYGPDIAGMPVGNPNLVPETNHYLEASWREENASYEAGISLFQNRLANLFYFSFGAPYQNQQRFIAEGIEVSGKLLGSKVEAIGSFTHQQFREEDTPVIRRPSNTAVASVSWFPQETLEFSATGRWFSSRMDDIGFRNFVKLNSYEVLDLGVRKSWEKDDVVLQVKNIFNREYEEIYGFSVLPRSVFMNWTKRF